jgi:hypothetical protein
MSADDRQVGGDHYKAWPALGSHAGWMTPEEFRGFLKGNVIKYLARTKNPNDLLKAQHYLEKLNSLDKPI